jgi:hypothetical protein
MVATGDFSKEGLDIQALQSNDQHHSRWQLSIPHAINI